MFIFLLSLVSAQSCDTSRFKVQSINEWSSTFPSYPPLDTSFYGKFVNMNGYPVTASSVTSDAAVLETAKWTCIMASAAHPSVLRNMIGYKGKITVMARYPLEKTSSVPEHKFLTPPSFWDERARGIGGTIQHPTSSCAEENVLCDAGDRYRGECIAIHEFAHTISLLSGNTTFLDRLEDLYKAAMSKKLWANTYAETNSQEYWAEGVQSWFDCNLHRDVADGNHGPISNRRAVKNSDPELAGLITDFFGDGPVRYQCPSDGPTNPTSTSSSTSQITTSSTGTNTATTTTTSSTGANTATSTISSILSSSMSSTISSSMSAIQTDIVSDVPTSDGTYILNNSSSSSLALISAFYPLWLLAIFIF